MAYNVESAELRDIIETLDAEVRPAVESLIGRLDAVDLAEREPRDVVGAAV